MGDMEFPVLRRLAQSGRGSNQSGWKQGDRAPPVTAGMSFPSRPASQAPYLQGMPTPGPTCPAYKVFEASKHGNIFSTNHSEWDFKNTQWTIGRDFTAPTCAACHISLLVNTESKVIANRTHEMKDRLPWRIFGLVYAHPHPEEADTSVIRNKDGLPLPTDFEGGRAEQFLRTRKNRWPRLRKRCRRFASRAMPSPGSMVIGDRFLNNHCLHEFGYSRRDANHAGMSGIGAWRRIIRKAAILSMNPSKRCGRIFGFSMRIPCGSLRPWAGGATTESSPTAAIS